MMRHDRDPPLTVTARRSVGHTCGTDNATPAPADDGSDLDIDDYLPVDASGGLLCATAEADKGFWPALLEKAVSR